MGWFWVCLGVVVLGAGLADIFLTSLNYDEAGFLATPLCTVQWGLLRRLTRRLPRRWRPVALRQVTGLQIGLSLLTWLASVVAGYGLIYYGLMSGRSFEFDGRDLGAGVFGARLYGAFYLSAAQLATVGTSQVTPETDLLRAVSIVETFTGVVLVTLALTFLLGVYQVVRDLSALSAKLFDVQRGAVNPAASDPVASLGPYFPTGRPTGVDAHLQGLHDSFSSYVDGLRLHHVAYYFQSGRDQFSLPYALDMLGGVVAALRWGLPGDHPAAQEPALTVLTLRFHQFAGYLHQRLRWRSTDVPELLPYETFATAYQGGVPGDLWLARFLTLNRDMAGLARVETAREAPDVAYQRYARWLPFAFTLQQVVAAVSRDLDYQPVLHSGQPSHGGELGQGGQSGQGGGRAGATRAPVPAGRSRPAARLRALLRRWVEVPDPGLTRLAGGARTVLAAVAAVATVYLLLSAAGVGQALPASMLGGMVGMQASTMARDATLPERRLTTILLVVPAVVGVSVGAAAEPSPAAAAGALVGVVLAGVWMRRYGSRFFALGQLLFMACYFALLLRLPLSLVPWLVLAAAVGMGWAYVARFVLIRERPDRVLEHGLAAFDARLVLLHGPLIDAVAGGRWDPDVAHRVRADQRQLRRCGAFLEGQLQGGDPAQAGPARPQQLRLAVFDVELAAASLVHAARDVAGAGTAVRRVLRAELAGRLETTQALLRRHPPTGAPAAGTFADMASRAVASPGADCSPASGHVNRPRWPAPAYRMERAVAELLDAAGALRGATATALADPTAQLAPVGADAATAPGPKPQPAAGDGLRATDRQAIQAGVATGLALVVGAAISPERQYWAAIAAFVVFGGTQTVGETVVKGVQRIAGTLAGAIVGFAVATLTGASPAVVLPLVVVCVFASMYVLSVSYSQMVFWVTMMIALLYEYLGKLSPEALELRVLETLVGAVIALAIAAFLLPTHTRERVRADMVAVLTTIQDISRACLATAHPERGDDAAGPAVDPSVDPAVGPVVDPAVLTGYTLTLNRRLQRMYDGAAPLRRAADALRRDGLERRLTAIQALTYYVRHLIGAVARSGPAPDLPAADLGQLRELTTANLQTLINLVNGEPSGELRDVEETLSPPDGSARPLDPRRQPLVWNAVRLNQTVLALGADLSPGSQEREATDS